MKSQIKIFMHLSLTMFLALPAQAEPIYDLLNAISFRINNGALNQLPPQSKNEIAQNLQTVLNLLDGSSNENLICAVSSNNSFYSRLNNGRLEIGGDSSKEECRELNRQAVDGLICARSLNHSFYFRAYKIRDGKDIGADMNKTDCLEVLQNSNSRYTCAVSTNHSFYFSIYDKKTGQRIGGDISKAACIEELRP